MSISAALFTPKSISLNIIKNLSLTGLLKITTDYIESIGSVTLAAKAQNQIVYAHAPYQPPNQADVKKYLKGTVYTINHTGSHKGKIYYTGYTSKGWGTTDMGVNLGNEFFSNYSSVKKWEKH